MRQQPSYIQKVVISLAAHNNVLAYYKQSLDYVKISQMIIQKSQKNEKHMQGWNPQKPTTTLPHHPYILCHFAATYTNMLFFLLLVTDRQTDRQTDGWMDRQIKRDLRSDLHSLVWESNVVPASHCVQLGRLLVPFTHIVHPTTLEEHVSEMTKK